MNNYSKHELILGLILIYFTHGVFPSTVLSIPLRIALLLSTYTAVALICGHRFQFSRRILITFLIFLALQSLSMLFGGISRNSEIVMMLSILSGLILSSLMPFGEFCKQIRIAIFWIALISLFFYGAGFVIDLVNVIPSFLQSTYNTGVERIISGTFVIMQHNTINYYRNYAIFSEPGQFQFFLNLGVIIELFSKRKPDYRYLLVIVLALITANSLNGMISFALIFLAYIVNQNGVKSLLRGTILVFIVMILILSLVQLKVIDVSNITSDINRKIQGLTGTYSYSSEGSGVERKRAIFTALSIFLSHPILGVAYQGFLSIVGRISMGDTYIMTCSPLNWFALYGMFFGILANVGYSVSFLDGKNSKTSNLLIVIALISMISAQSMDSSAFIWILIFYGFQKILSPRIFHAESSSIEDVI